VLERACALRPQDPELWVKRACLHLDRNELDDAKVGGLMDEDANWDL
jgi:hypothetical protein